MARDMTKPRVLTFVDYYLPGFKSGGPLRTISNLVDHLGREFRFLIVSRDRDIQDTVPYPGVKIGAWNTLGDAEVFYAPPNFLSLRRMARLMREMEHDIVFLNSFFSPRMTIIPRLCMYLGFAPRKPFIIAPRGEFAVSALSLKQARKWIFSRVTKLLGLYHGAVWLASTEHEATDIRRAMGSFAKDIFIASNLPRNTEEPIPPAVNRKLGDPLKVVFLARISPIKNLDFALRVLRHVSSNIAFSIYGPIEDVVYWQKCQDLISDLPGNIKITHMGSVATDQVRRVLSSYDLFFLPTRGENYGHVIAESLSVGTPVLISDQTPWRNLHIDQFGWALPLDDEKAFAHLIDDCALSGTVTTIELRRSIKEKAIGILGNPKILEANRELFTLTLKRGN